MRENNSAFVDFEFRLEDPVTMLPADELFSDGKLMPLQRFLIQKSRSVTMTYVFRSPDIPKLLMRNEISLTDPYLFSSKAPQVFKPLERGTMPKKNSTGTAMRSKKIKRRPHHPIITIVKMPPEA
ncbi:Uncharacterized protein Fot_00875 [Forsythia ovata]|uniref:Uncharacterized protein n=1 Tax=Forsythia ovata TaxID=205694 RepID=A0ABD1X2C7_9LAMI